MSVHFSELQLFKKEVERDETVEAKLVVCDVDEKYTVHCKLFMMNHSTNPGVYNAHFSLQILSPRIQSCSFFVRVNDVDADVDTDHERLVLFGNSLVI